MVLVVLNSIIITVWKCFKGEFKIILLFIFGQRSWISLSVWESTHFIPWFTFCLVQLTVKTSQILYNNQFQSILMFYQRIPSYFMSVFAWEGVGYSQYYSVLYGYSILPSYPGTNCTCTIHVTTTNPSVIPPLSLPKHTNTSVVHRCIYKNNAWTIIIVLWF